MNRRSPSLGFTLLEILVVLVIIGVLIGFASLSVNGVADSERLEQSARRLVLTAGLAAQQAVLSARPIGIVLHGSGFTLSEFNQGWQPLDESERFAATEFESGIIVRASAGAEDFDASTPSLVFLPDGERFLPDLELYDVNTRYSLMVSSVNGDYKISLPQNRSN